MESTQNIEATAVSHYILNTGELIEQSCGLEPSSFQEKTAAIEEWIPDDQISPMQVIQLRTAEQTASSEAVKLKQFNPNFFLKESDEIRCRVPKCRNTSPQGKPTQSYEKTKQDLYICGEHLASLKDDVKRRCKEENVTVDFDSYKAENFNGYTYSIGLLEKAFMYLKKRWLRASLFDSQLAEVFLNTRNYLVITNALLNPNRDNMEAVLGPLFYLLREILRVARENPELAQGFITALRDVMSMTLNFFQIEYSWVFLTIWQKIGVALVAAGVGFLVGYTSARLLGFSPWESATNAAVGVFSGLLICGSIYNWYNGRRRISASDWYSRSYNGPSYCVLADRSGSISIYAHPRAIDEL